MCCSISRRGYSDHEPVRVPSGRESATRSTPIRARRATSSRAEGRHEQTILSCERRLPGSCPRSSGHVPGATIQYILSWRRVIRRGLSGVRDASSSPFRPGTGRGRERHRSGRRRPGPGGSRERFRQGRGGATDQGGHGPGRQSRRRSQHPDGGHRRQGPLCDYRPGARRVDVHRRSTWIPGPVQRAEHSTDWHAEPAPGVHAAEGSGPPPAGSRGLSAKDLQQQLAAARRATARQQKFEDAIASYRTILTNAPSLCQSSTCRSPPRTGT